MAPKRILHVTSVLNYGGIENLLINVFRRIDRKEIIFDFLVIREENGIYEKEIELLGGKIYKISSLKKVGIIKFQKNLDCFFNSHKEYSIVHSHVNAWSYYILKSAKKHGIPTRIAHSHTSSSQRGFLLDKVVTYNKKRLVNHSTHLFACSGKAASFLFGDCSKNSIIIKNGIDCNRFSFSIEARNRIRRELNLENHFVIITVGRLSKEKNHLFFLDILSEIKKAVSSVLWICIGEGKLLNDIKTKAEHTGVISNVLFLGKIENVEDYLSASDVYTGTSEFEGFGISAIEAQCNGLPCVISDGFPVDVKINRNCILLSLGDSQKKWVECIINSKRISENTAYQNVFESGFDIESTTQFLSEFYKKFE